MKYLLSRNEHKYTVGCSLFRWLLVHSNCEKYSRKSKSLKTGVMDAMFVQKKWDQTRCGMFTLPLTIISFELLVQFSFSKWRNVRPIRWIEQNYSCMNRIQLQPDTSTENILVQSLEWLTVKQAIWVQFLFKSLHFLVIFSCSICLNRRKLWKNSNENVQISMYSWLLVWWLHVTDKKKNLKPMNPNKLWVVR